MRLPAKSISYSLSFFIPIGFLILFNILGTLELLNRKVSDILMSLYPNHHSFSEEIVILDIDEHSLAYYADHPLVGRWPWKRSIYPSMYAYLNMAGAKLIINDILFTEHSPEDDSIVIANQTFPEISHSVSFRDNVTKDKNSFDLSKWGKFSTEIDGQFKAPIFARASFPNGEIGASSNHLHAVNVIPDADGVLRRFALFLSLGGKYFPSLPTVAYFDKNPIQVKSNPPNIELMNPDRSPLKMHLTESGYVRSYFYSNEMIQKIPRYSASSVLESFARIQEGMIEDESQLVVPLSAFSGKIVLIGTTAPSTHDDVVTPFGLFPGVIAQSIFVSNLLEGHFFREIDVRWSVFLCIILITVITYFLFHSDNNWFRIAIPLGFMILIFFISFLLYTQDILLPISPFLIGLPLSFILGYSYVTFKEGSERRKYSSVLRNLIDPSVVSLALQDIELLKKGGEWEITAFFSDVAGFSSISEELSATDLASLLNEYLSAMTDQLKIHSGTLDKYIGDAIVGMFGAPIRSENHPKDACLAALAMVDEMEKLRNNWNLENKYSASARAMSFRIGLNCGNAKVGFMGTESLASYTMMGDMVNLAARLESAAKDYGVPILASESIQKKCSEDFQFLMLDRIRVKGKDHPVVIYSLLGEKGKFSSEQLKWTQSYNQGFNEYLNRNWKGAISFFEQSMKEKGERITASQLLIDRCNHYTTNPPERNWDGVFTRKEK